MRSGLFLTLLASAASLIQAAPLDAEAPAQHDLATKRDASAVAEPKFWDPTFKSKCRGGIGFGIATLGLSCIGSKRDAAVIGTEHDEAAINTKRDAAAIGTEHDEDAINTKRDAAAVAKVPFWDPTFKSKCRGGWGFGVATFGLSCIGTKRDAAAVAEPKFFDPSGKSKCGGWGKGIATFGLSCIRL